MIVFIGRWRKSTHSNPNGECIEVGAWRKSSYSGPAGDCVEAGTGPSAVGVRDTKDRGDGPVLVFSPAAWAAFTAARKAGLPLR